MKKRTIINALVIALVLVAVVAVSFTVRSAAKVDCADCGGMGYTCAYTCVDCEGTGAVDEEACAVCAGVGGLEPADCETCGATGEVAAESRYYATFASLAPAVVAIVLALVTKEVYSSLFVGIVVGALFTSNYNVVGAVDTLVNDGVIAAVSGTAGIFAFLVILGALVALINKAGGSAAFGRWACEHIKSRIGAQIATFILGVLIFIDDYFNCLTVGSVMRPVTDSNRISRAKLSYLIDATAAPICMIAPISSWAAAVSEYTKGVVGANGEEISSLALFIKAIPYNFYSLLTFVFIIAIVLMKFDYGPMKKHERNAMENDDLFTFGGAVTGGEEAESGNKKGRVIDLVLPIVVLIAVSVFALIYVGGYFGGDNAHNFVGAFGDTDATVGLPLAGIVVLVFAIIYMMCRRLVSFKEAMSCIPKGFIAMVPAILILTMATALKNMTGLLGSDAFVDAALANADGLRSFLPAIIFLVACGISFATGTSWGTFGILIPIVLSVFPAGELMIIGMSACLAGSVCGDHCSPISDTTIMSSAGAQCEHVNHVSTQLPYSLTVAAVSFVGYVMAGFVQAWYIVLPVMAVLMVAVLFVIKMATKEKKA